MSAKVNPISKTHRVADFGAPFWYARHGHKFMGLKTMVKLAKDPKYIGSGKLGMTGVLHTWGRHVGYHPDVHFIVPGGAIGNRSECKLG